MANVREDKLVSGGALPPTDFHEAIERIREVAAYELEIPPNLTERLGDSAKGLVVPQELLRAAGAALQTGHVVIQGPPGTGKSTLARALAKAFNASTFAVTAHEDWTVYEVIGRLELRLSADRKEEIVPVNGHLTESVIRCANAVVQHFDDPDHPQAEWLLIDELNRAHLDKAFGELFSVLGTDELVPVNLPHQSSGNRELVIPKRFRILATLNSYDKQFVNSLSQAIRRRFTFLTFDIPPRKPAEVSWSYDEASPHPAIKELVAVINRVATRIAKRHTSLHPEEEQGRAAYIVKQLKTDYFGYITRLFTLLDDLRYATEGGKVPHIPISTAHAADTVELFMTRVLQDGVSASNAGDLIDWAVSVKIVPSFESDAVDPNTLRTYAESLNAPFSHATRRELLMIAAAGTHFVGD